MDTATPSSLRLLEQRPFVLFWLARVAATIGSQMMALLIGWQVYALTGSAFDLGLVGLIQFVPSVVLTLLIGHAADRYDRRLIVRDWAYYLENRLRESYGLEGVPLVIDFVPRRR